MAGSRKLAAILIADIAGYSRLARSDEDRTLARVRALQADPIGTAIMADARRIDFRMGIHLGDVIEESGDDLMGDGVNVAARLAACRTRATGC